MIKELRLNNTYKEVHKNDMNVISRHLDFMLENEIDVLEHLNICHDSTG